MMSIQRLKLTGATTLVSEIQHSPATQPKCYATNLRFAPQMDELELQVVDKAQRAVDQLRDRSNDSLDYTESSLTMVEDILAEAADFVSQMPDDQVDALVHLLGSYILEVGRHEFGGKYYWHDGRDQPVLVVGEPDFRIAILTFDKVRGRLSGDSADNIPFFIRDLQCALGVRKQELTYCMCELFTDTRGCKCGITSLATAR